MISEAFSSLIWNLSPTSCTCLALIGLGAAAGRDRTSRTDGTGVKLAFLPGFHPDFGILPCASELNPAAEVLNLILLCGEGTNIGVEKEKSDFN